jgi:hypothetical protein
MFFLCPHIRTRIVIKDWSGLLTLALFWSPAGMTRPAIKVLEFVGVLSVGACTNISREKMLAHAGAIARFFAFVIDMKPAA